jgi:hypothetical protein
MANNEFLVSVGRVVVRDATTLEGLMYGQTQITTAYTTAMTSTEVRAGRGNALLMVYMHDKKIDVKLDDATFSMKLLGFNSGQLPTTGTFNVLQTESVTLVANVGTLSLNPTSDVAVYFSDNSIQNLTPIGKSFTTVAGGSQTVTVVYSISTTAEQVRIETATPPKVLNITILGDIRNDAGELTHYLQIEIPKLQVDGNFTYSMAANGVSQTALSGYALSSIDTDGTLYQAKQTKVPVATAATVTTGIVAIPSGMSFTAGVAGAQTSNVLAIRGTTNVNVTSSSSYVTNSASFVVGLHTGLISISASAALTGSTGSAIITYTSGSSTFTDWINLFVP